MTTLCDFTRNTPPGFDMVKFNMNWQLYVDMNDK